MTLFLARIIPEAPRKYVLPPDTKHPDSDTLFGALVTAWCIQKNNSLNEVIEQITISSGFPVVKVAGKEIFFLPISSYIKEKLSEDEDTFNKKIKKTKYVSASLYTHLNENIELVKDIVLFGDFLMTKPEARLIEETLHEDLIDRVKEEGFITRTEAPRNTIDRLTQSSSLYYQQYIQPLYTKRIKTYYWMLISDKDIKTEKLASTLKLMGENGIGGERSLGFGKSKILLDKPLQWMETSYSVIKNKQLLISLLYDDKKIILEQIKKELSISGIIVKRRFLKKQFVEIGFIREGTTNRERISGKIIMTQTKPNKLFNGKGFWISIPL